jgi:malate dehydrogenase (oxaloacetate-decarboxylating)
MVLLSVSSKKNDIIKLTYITKGMITLTNLDQEALILHKLHPGKLSVCSTVPLKTAHDLSIAYTPGVGAPCLKINANPETAYQYTSKGHMVAIVTDGSAVLGLGNIGALAAIPVMEGKAALLKQFSGLDAFPICLDTQDPQAIIETVVRIAPMFGAIMLEDIAAPQCVLIERELKKRLAIPVFHDDQHGTAVVVAAAVTNAFRLLKKDLAAIRVVISGTGAAGSAICRMLTNLGIKTINAYNKQGIVTDKKYDSYDFLIRELLDQSIISSYNLTGSDTLGELIKGADLFIGVSAPDLINASMIKSMAKDPVVFAMANPKPEIMPEIAHQAGAIIVGTGRSDYPNQINNVLIFPGIFKGALQARAPQISEAMKVVASQALASLVKDTELSYDYILPNALDRRVVTAVAKAVKKQALKEKEYSV